MASPIRIALPATPDEIRKLRIGNEVLVSGRVLTGRDVAHKFMVEKKPEFLREYLKGGAIYHCGPVVKKVGSGWEIVAAGPTTSIREEPYQADVIAQYGMVGVIGKGGMREKTAKSLQEHGAVYLHAPGGCAAVLARAITRVVDVLMLEEFGTPEAFWVLDVEDFPAVVTMDSHGGSLHKAVLDLSRANLDRALASV